MTTSAHLCTPDDLERLTTLALRRYEEAGQTPDPDHITAGFAPLTEGGPMGAVWLFGPVRAPVGYMAVTFRWSVPDAALEAELADIYIRPSVRRRGLGFEVIHDIAKALGASGIAKMTVTPPTPDDDMHRLARRLRFAETGSTPALVKSLL